MQFFRGPVFRGHGFSGPDAYKPVAGAPALPVVEVVVNGAAADMGSQEAVWCGGEGTSSARPFRAAGRS